MNNHLFSQHFYQHMIFPNPLSFFIQFLFFCWWLFICFFHILYFVQNYFCDYYENILTWIFRGCEDPTGMSGGHRVLPGGVL